MRVVMLNSSAGHAGVIVYGRCGAGGGLFQRVGLYGLGSVAVVPGGIDRRVLVSLYVADVALLMLDAVVGAGGFQVYDPTESVS